jgi:SAM-dependent methyltransferase
MRFVDELIGRQIRHPSGWLGATLGHVMALEHRPLTRWTLDFLGVDPNDSVVDIGCGGGMAIGMTAESAAVVFGIDYAPRMVEQSRIRNRLLILQERAGIVRGAVSALPFRSGSFDKAYGIETLYFWPDPVADLAEVRRVLRPGGAVALAMDISKEGRDPAAIEENATRLGFRIYSRGELEELMRCAGFTRVFTRVLAGQGKGWICVKGSRPDD